MPVSQAALDVFRMTSSDNADVQSIAAMIALDASLSFEVLRLANRAFYCPGGKKVTALDEAVLRIGQKRVGELALGSAPSPR